VFGEKTEWHVCRKFTCVSITGGRLLYYKGSGVVAMHTASDEMRYLVKRVMIDPDDDTHIAVINCPSLSDMRFSDLKRLANAEEMTNFGGLCWLAACP
jgi:hypothetical protein